MNKVETAVSCFKGGFLCSQAILSTYGPDLGLAHETALKIAGPFGGGMARMGQTCGAVIGAFMLIGLKYGQSDIEDDGAKEKAYELVRKMTDSFISRHGAIECRTLLGCDLGTTEGYAYARSNDLFMTLCPKFVQDAAEIVEHLI